MNERLTNRKRRFAQIIFTCLVGLWPHFDAVAQDAPEASDDGNVNDKLITADEKTVTAYQAYKDAAARYKHEIQTYKLDLRRNLMSDYQDRISSVDAAYQKKITALRNDEKAMRENVIERMESFLKRYGETHEKSADILYRLARLYYERSDDEYLSSDGSAEHPDFTQALDTIDKLQKNFPNYDQMDGALYLKGYCQGQMGENEASRDTFLQLIAAYPNNPRKAEVLTRIGEYYFSKSQDAILGLEGEIMWSEALKYYTEAVEVGKDSAIYDRALYRKAWTEYYTEDYDGMIHDFIALVGYADKVENGSALRAEAIDFMAAALAEEDWDLSDDVAIDPDFGMERFDKYLHTGAAFETEVLRKFADTLMEQTRYEYAAQAYEAYIEREDCAEDMPDVIRVYVAALNYSGKLDKAAQVQGSIDKRIGIDSEWYACQERNGNLEAIANANQATQQALKNSIIAYHDNVLKAEDNVRIAEEALDAAQNDIERQAASIKLENAQREVRTTNAELAEITASFVKTYPNDEEIYNYRYLLGQAYYYSEQYEKSISAFMAIRDIENSRFQADAARYIADAYEFSINQKAQTDPNYVNALPLQVLIERVNRHQMTLTEAPTSILLSGAITSYTKDEIDEELKNRKGGSLLSVIPDDVQQLIDARERFSDIEIASGKNETDPTALAPQYRYDNAITYYNYGNFEKAEQRFLEIIEKSPASQHAVSAAEIIIAEYELRGDLDKVAQLSDQFGSMQLGSADSDSVLNTRFKDKKYNALFQKAFKLFDNKQYLEAAAEFVRIIEENPTFEHNNRALYNAAYAYEQMKHYDSAMQMYRRVISDYGESEEAVSALYRIGVNAEMFFDFDTAIDSFLSLYNNKKPLYREFKYRVNALRNAARIKLLIEDKKGAAELLERYHRDYPGQSDAPQYFYEAGRAYAELGQIAEAQRIFKDFRKKYASDPSMRAYVIASYVSEADYLRSHNRRHDIKTAKSYYQTAVTLYQNAPSSAGAIGRDNAAKAAFALAEMEYETWRDTPIKGKMKSMMTQLQEHMKEMKRIYNEFAQVMAYNSPVWGIASRYAIARMMHELVLSLDDMPCPSDIRSGSDNHLAFLSAMSDMATGTRDEAIKMYQNAIDASKLAGISMEWTEKSLDGLKQLDRTASAQERLAPMVNNYHANVLLTPSEFKRQEAEKSEAEAKAQAELDAILKGDDSK